MKNPAQKDAVRSNRSVQFDLLGSMADRMEEAGLAGDKTWLLTLDLDKFKISGTLVPP